jgi:O-methyltransferase
MLKNALHLLLHNRAAFAAHLRQRALAKACRLVSRSSVYLQCKMDIHPRSWWHNPEFVAGTGGFFVANDPTKRTIEDLLDPWDNVRRDMIVLLMREITERQVPGDLAELGVYRGSTARLIHHYLPERKFYLFDTFAGFDERDVKAEQTKSGRKTDAGGFVQTSLERARNHIAPLNDNVQFFPGYFPQSAPEFLRERKFALVNLDADLYEPTFAGLNFFYDRLSPGGFILVHDFNSWAGSRKAIRDFFRDKPETPIPMPDKSGSALIAKMRS